MSFPFDELLKQRSCRAPTHSARYTPSYQRMIQLTEQRDPYQDIDKDEGIETQKDETISRFSSLETDGNNMSDPPAIPPGLSTPIALLATVLFVAFWPLLALLRTTSSPIDGFDIDMFMALKGIIDTPIADRDATILELPSLSPAEQLVGAIFGPPQ